MHPKQENMKKIHLLISLAALLAASCGNPQKPVTENHAISSRKVIEGDSTRYGLACDGSTDSILVFLRDEGGDPDTLNIIQAREERRIYGRPRIGDQLAVIVLADSTAEVESVINLSQLQGQWCYQVTPTLRPSAHHPLRPLPDSIRQRIMAPREYGIRLRRDGTAFTIGMRRQQSIDAMSPVKYPEVKRYASWHVFNGHIILEPTDSTQQSDTVDVQLLRRDTLVLRFNDHEQGYYRKENGS